MKTIQEINAIRDRVKKEIANRNNTKATRIVVGFATCGIAAGATPVFDAFVTEVKKHNLKNVEVIKSGCLGMCKYEPMVEILVPGENEVTYVHLTPDKVAKIVEQHLVNGKVCSEFLIQEA
ncbi:MAG: (2Fe-2S) ferredoxin domain-containing protein [Christensenellales bacterium]|jgi:NADP-reducing hydrogenase subunit HndB